MQYIFASIYIIQVFVYIVNILRRKKILEKSASKQKDIIIDKKDKKIEIPFQIKPVTIKLSLSLFTFPVTRCLSRCNFLKSPV